MQRLRGSAIASNLIWLLISVLLATGVWYIAVTSADPIDSRRFSSLRVQFEEGSGTVITNQPTLFVSVLVRGPQSILSTLLSEDIEVSADLTALQPGTHSVPLTVRVASGLEGVRRPIGTSQPTQLTVELELLESFQKPVILNVTHEPPIGFRYDEPVRDVHQVLVSGASSAVSEVAAVHGDLDLSDSRNPIETSVRLYAVDAEGSRLSDIRLELQTMPVAVNITRRDDIRQIPVRPNILVDTLAVGYTLSAFSPEPQWLFISGAPEQLADIPDTLLTAPISLENRPADFEVVVPVVLPQVQPGEEELFVMGGSNITVAIEISPIIADRSFDNIEISPIGLGEGYAASIVPRSVSAIVNGPVSLVDALAAEDIQLIVDLNGLPPGIYDDVLPQVAVNQSELSEANVSLSPAAVNVEIAPTAPETDAAAPPSG